MSNCCIGGVCIPTQAVIPVCILLLRQLYFKILSWYNKLMGIETKDECDDSCCKSTSTPTKDTVIDAAGVDRRGKRGKTLTKDDDNSLPKMMESVEEFGKVLKEYDFVVTKFTASWCGPCKLIEPTYALLGRESKAKFIKVDVDELDEIAQVYGISMMPTFVVFKNGKNVASMSGSNETQLKSFIEKNTI